MTSVYGYNTPGNMRVFGKKPECIPETVDDGSVLSFLRNNPKTTLFTYIIELAGLEWLLGGPMFDSTIFVPIDSELTDKYSKNMFVNMSPETAFEIVKYSTLSNKIEYWLLSTLNYSELVPRSSHDRITLVNVGGRITLNGAVKVLPSDVVCTNGVILFTDNILIPSRV